MSFSTQVENDFLERMLMVAIDEWEPARPRRWLARYGGLSNFGIGNGKVAKEYKQLLALASGIVMAKQSSLMVA